MGCGHCLRRPVFAMTGCELLDLAGGGAGMPSLHACHRCTLWPEVN
ncbi:hypothetical protein I546_6535 [Mycobacterium kansasii 732]|nr:hypothetical protein I546_6535 [Mycobacterium kansasii 732]